MTTDSPKKSFESTLRAYLEQEEGRTFLAGLSHDSIDQVSRKIIEENTFGDIALLEKLVTGVWKESSCLPFIRHSLWCAHREAYWRMPATSERKNTTCFKVRGEEHLLNTHGHPTIVISPMSLCTDDAMEAVQRALSCNQPGRPIICYGEDMENFLDRNPHHQFLFANDSLQGIRTIINVLQQGGIFLTYPDFVYRHHHAIQHKLFGINRSYSAGLIKIAAHTHAALLPATLKHCNDTIEICFFSPIPGSNFSQHNSTPRPVKEQALTIFISRLLESLILQIPNQWRLLPTLAYESPEMARSMVQGHH